MPLLDDDTKYAIADRAREFFYPLAFLVAIGTLWAVAWSNRTLELGYQDVLPPLDNAYQQAIDAELLADEEDCSDPEPSALLPLTHPDPEAYPDPDRLAHLNPNE